MAEPAVGCTAELERLGDEIACCPRTSSRHAHLLDLIREFDARAGWNTGFRSCAECCRGRVGLDRARPRARSGGARARTLPRRPGARRGELSYAKVRALTRVGPGNREAARGGAGRGPPSTSSASSAAGVE